MPFSDALFQIPLTAMPLSQLLMSMMHLALLGGLLVFFRPLLTGIGRALVLLVRPRPGRHPLAVHAQQVAVVVDASEAHPIAASS
jgi:hypothetical protein